MTSSSSFLIRRVIYCYQAIGHIRAIRECISDDFVHGAVGYRSRRRRAVSLPSSQAQKLHAMMRAGYSKLLMLLTRWKLNLDDRRSIANAVDHFFCLWLALDIIPRRDNTIGMRRIPESLNLSVMMLACSWKLARHAGHDPRVTICTYFGAFFKPESGGSLIPLDCGIISNEY